MGTEQHRCSEAKEAISSLQRILHAPCFQRYGTNDSLKCKLQFWPWWVSVNNSCMKAASTLQLPPRLVVVHFLECSNNKFIYVPGFGNRRVHSSPVMNVTEKNAFYLKRSVGVYFGRRQNLKAL